eukprot:5187691-Pleurochrysis_carterae.AAC.1
MSVLTTVKPRAFPTLRSANTTGFARSFARLQRCARLPLPRAARTLADVRVVFNWRRKSRVLVHLATLKHLLAQKQTAAT